jgi:hypothetical protein
VEITADFASVGQTLEGGDLFGRRVARVNVVVGEGYLRALGLQGYRCEEGCLTHPERIAALDRVSLGVDRIAPGCQCRGFDWLR